MKSGRTLFFIGALVVMMVAISSSASAIGVISGTYEKKYDYQGFFQVEGELSGFGTSLSENPNPFWPPYWNLNLNFGENESVATVYKPFFGICSNGIICGITLSELHI